MVDESNTTPSYLSKAFGPTPQNIGSLVCRRTSCLFVRGSRLRLWFTPVIRFVSGAVRKAVGETSWRFIISYPGKHIQGSSMTQAIVNCYVGSVTWNTTERLATHERSYVVNLFGCSNWHGCRRCALEIRAKDSR